MSTLPPPQLGGSKEETSHRTAPTSLQEATSPSTSHCWLFCTGQLEFTGGAAPTSRPVLQLPGTDKPTVVVRCCPLLFEPWPSQGRTAFVGTMGPLKDNVSSLVQGRRATHPRYSVCPIGWCTLWPVWMLCFCMTLSRLLPSATSPTSTTPASPTSLGEPPHHLPFPTPPLILHCCAGRMMDAP